MMNFQETVDYLYSFLPMFQRQGNAAIRRYDLEGVLDLCKHFGHPQEQLKAIHVAGTNGKGSTCSMLASILMESGISKVGLYTSPHLRSFTERIRINGKNIPEQEVVRFVAQHKELLEELKPSFFEFTTAMAFSYFAKEADVCIIEVGMGGRLDSTNIINPILSVITHISLDHTEFLGDTLEKIAYEKGGIIKPITPVVISVTQPETENVFREIAAAKNAPITFAEREIEISMIKQNFRGNLYNVNHRNNIPSEFEVLCDLAGIYQYRNIPGVLEAISTWNKKLEELKLSFPKVTHEAILKGLAHVVKNSGLRGRMEILSEKPLTIADIAHNPDAIRQLMMQLSEYPAEKLHFVIGFVKEKDLDQILLLFPAEAQYYFVCPPVPRGLSADETRKQAEKYHLSGKSYHTVNEGLHSAMENAKEDEIVIVTGSAFVVAEIIPQEVVFPTSL